MSANAKNADVEVTVAADRTGVCASGWWSSIFRCNRCVCDPVSSEVPPCGYNFPEVAVDLPGGPAPEVSHVRLQNALDRVEAKGQFAKVGDSHRSPLPSADRAAGRGGGHVRPANVPLLRLDGLGGNQQPAPAASQQHKELINAFKELDDEAASFECHSPSHSPDSHIQGSASTKHDSPTKPSEKVEELSEKVEQPSKKVEEPVKEAAKSNSVAEYDISTPERKDSEDQKVPASSPKVPVDIPQVPAEKETSQSADQTPSPGDNPKNSETSAAPGEKQLMEGQGTENADPASDAKHLEEKAGDNPKVENANPASDVKQSEEKAGANPPAEKANPVSDVKQLEEKAGGNPKVEYC